MSGQKHAPGSFLGSLLGVVGFSALAGVLVTSTVTPAVAVTSNAANTAFSVIDSLPEYATINEQSERNRLWAVAGDQWVQIAQMYDQNRQVITWQEVPNFIRWATLSGEDRRFYQHNGVDAVGLFRAVVANITGGDVQGASTLTMQLVRSQWVMEAFVAGDEEAQEAATEQSLSRKLRETRLAIGLESLYTKDEIMLAYLNIANFGGNIYGVEAAAQHYFGVSAMQLTVAQAASIMAIVQFPASRNLLYPENYAANQERRDHIIEMMANDGYITQEQAAEALAIPVDENFVHITDQANGCLTGWDSARFFCDYVEHVIYQDKVGESFIFGETAEENRANWMRGGYDIYTTLNLQLNDAAQATLDEYVPNWETAWVSGGAVYQVEVGTGRIITMAQNKDFDNRPDAPYTSTSVNFNTNFDYGGSGGFQPGSTWKIFTLEQWIANGHSPNETVNGRNRNFTGFQNSCLGGMPSFNPNNDSGQVVGDISVIDATVRSLNTPFVAMAQQLDLCQIAQAAAAMGVQPAMGGELESMPSSIIGSGSNVSPMSMANAMATIANNGVYCTPVAIDRILDRDGVDVQPPTTQCTQAISPEVASVMQYVLQIVTERNAHNPDGSFPVISKTGTNDNVEQTWVIGATTTIATAVWIGNIVGNVSLLDGWITRQAVFKSAVWNANEYFPGGTFMPPDATTLQGNSVAVPDVTGMTPQEAQTTLRNSGFQTTIADAVPGQQEAGMVENTSPAAGTMSSQNGMITIYPSDGSLRFPMPQLVGSTFQSAAATLVGLGVDANHVSATFEGGPANQVCTILSQNPVQGTQITRGAWVSLVIGSSADGVNPNC